MRQDVQTIFDFSITVRDVLGNTLWAMVCGSLIALFYVLAFRRVSYSVGLVKSIVMLTMITAFVMMVVGDNLAQAFSMVGILSIIRFRTAMKAAQDFMFLFFALAIGLACGEGLYSVALVGCLLIGFVVLIMTYALATTHHEDVTLTIISKATTAKASDYTPILASFCKRHKVVGTQASKLKKGSLMQLSYLASLKSNHSREALIEALQGLDDVKQVTLALEE